MVKKFHNMFSHFDTIPAFAKIKHVEYFCNSNSQDSCNTSCMTYTLHAICCTTSCTDNVLQCGNGLLRYDTLLNKLNNKPMTILSSPMIGVGSLVGKKYIKVGRIC